MRNHTILIFFSIFSLFLNQASTQFIVGPANPSTSFLDYNTTQLFDQSFDPKNVGYLYSGYINISSTRSYHFYFAQKTYQNYTPIDLNTKMPNDYADLIVWLNGGPGCSSLDGAFNEHGPILINGIVNNLNEVQFRANPYSWNQAANILYLESGPGVGFSYKLDQIPQDDYTVGENNMQALLQFLQGFYPDTAYTKRVWIAGESYAGTYVPYFFNAIYEYNQQNPTQQINVQGWMCGNPCTAPQFGECTGQKLQGPMNIADTHALSQFGILNDTILNEYINNCQTNSNQCQQISQVAMTLGRLNVSSYDPWLNFYDLKRECLQDVLHINASSADLSLDSATHNSVMKSKYFFNKHQNEGENLNDDEDAQNYTTNSCIEFSSLYYFLNDPKKRQNFNIQQSAENYTWYICDFTKNLTSTYNFTPSPNGSYWLYEKYVAMDKFKIMVYSGETDFAVPIWGTISWITQLIQDLQLNLMKNKRNWFYQDATQMYTKIAGSIEQYSNNFNFVTVYGVGHMVPQWQKPGALQMVNSFINNLDFPNYNQISNEKQNKI